MLPADGVGETCTVWRLRDPGRPVPMAQSTGNPTNGVDQTSTLGEITDAFGRKGIQLAFRPVEDGWEAVVSAQGVETFEWGGPTRLEAARGAWREYVERNGGTGES